MKFIINETGEERELHFYHPSSPEDMADDLIGNSGAVGDYIKSIPGDNQYSISEEDYQWWAEYLETVSYTHLVPESGRPAGAEACAVRL